MNYSTGSSAGDEESFAEYRPVSASYFSVLRIPIVRGRGFSDAENVSVPTVCLINESIAQSQFPNGDELGARITINGQFQCEVIGVVGDVAPASPAEPPAPAIYVPFYQMPGNAWFMSVLARNGNSASTGNQDYMTKTLVRVIRELAPTFPVQVVSMSAIVDERSAVERFRALLMATVSIIAAILAALGVYGITAHYVLQRRREIAIRMALGASPGRIISEIEKRTLRLAFVGLTLAFLVAYPTFKLVKGLMFGVHHLEFAPMVGTAALVLILALLSAYLPSRRTLEITPRRLLEDA
jgi:ABC-type antimicrobial peptide transport system permease subunit